MKLTQLFKEKETTLSFEVFPPKVDSNYDSVKFATEHIAGLKPDYMSVTYGAGGGTSDFTVDIASNLQNTYNVTTLAHLTCLSSTKEKIRQQLEKLKENKIENILALRGDIPKDFDQSFRREFHYASELISEIKKNGDFCIGGACYPECHPESRTISEDIRYLKEKTEMGCDFLTTQMFFDNGIMYNYLYKIREAGITVPIIAGIMPVTNGSQIDRICKLSGTYLPRKFVNIVDKFGDNPPAMKQAGVAYATEQIIDLVANGVTHIHIYSMNKPEVAEEIKNSLSEIIK